MKKLIILVSLFCTTSVFAQTEVLSGVTMGKDYGVVYTLPKTEINIEVKATKVTYTPGEFSRYADRYLRLNDVSGDPEEYWELTSVQATSVGVPDNEQTYFIKMKDKTVAPLVELTEDGLIKSINVPINKKVDSPVQDALAEQIRRVNPRDFLTEEILMSSSSAKMAELIAKEIYNIRESRNALLRGQADNMPKDGEQLRLMLENLEMQENAMVEMFSGVETKEEKIYNIRVLPTREFSDEVIFRFSKKLGVVAKDDLSGEPVYLNLTNLNAVTIPQDDGKKKKTEGVVYNVPGRANLVITDGNGKLFEEDVPVTQFGLKEYLAPELFNKNSTVKVTFNPATGGIIKVDRD